MSKPKLSTRCLAEAAILVALAQVLSYIKLMELPNGGSLTPAMFPLLLFAVRWGVKPGLLAGFALHLPAFWIYTCLKFDQIAKTVWCVFRLRSGKWIKRISTGKQGGASA